MLRTAFASPYDSRQTLKVRRFLQHVVFGRTVLTLFQNPWLNLKTTLSHR